MRYLVDTNIILRFVDRSHPIHPSISTTVEQLRQDGNHLHIAPQNCVEFWNVATRPLARNGFGFKPGEADRLLSLVEQIFLVLPDSPAVYTEWRRLVVTFGVSGVQVHDARLVAAMRFNNIQQILTLNTADFKRYASEGIVAVEPTSIRSDDEVEN